MNSRNKKLAVAAAVFLGLGAWMSSRWGTWFGNQPEPAYQTAAAPHNVLLTMGNSGPCSRIVTWQADTLAQTGALNLRYNHGGKCVDSSFAAACQVVATRSGKVAFYSVQIDSIPLGATGLAYTVRTGASEAGPFRFAMPADYGSTEFVFMGDVQDSAQGLSHSYFQAIDSLHPNAAFWLFGGDLVERPMDKWWQVVFADLDSIATRRPILSIGGNHEYLKGVVKELDPRVAHTFGYFLQSRVGSNHVYSFAQGPVRFFLLDSNADCWNLPSQRGWLENELGKCAEKWKVVVLHHPLYSNKGSHYNPLVKWAFASLVKDYGVDLVLQGHEHVYARWNDKDEQGRYLAPVYLSSLCSPKQYQLRFGQPEDRLGTNARFYQHIVCNADSLALWTFTLEDGRVYDHICLSKPNGNYQVADYYKTQPQKVEVSEWFRKNKARHLQEYQNEIEQWKKRTLDK